MRNPYRQAIHRSKFIFIIILFLLSSCNQAVVPLDTSPTHSQTESPTQAPMTATPSHTPTATNTATPSPSPTPTRQQEIDPQVFDYTMLDLMQWEGDWEVSDIEKHKPGYIVEVREGYKTMLYAAPLYDEHLEIEDYYYGFHELDVPEGFNFELLETRKITGEDGRNVIIGILRNGGGITTCEGVYAIALSAENERGERIDFVNEQSEIIATASISDLLGDLALKDQAASMLLLRNILKYQQEHGPFLAGETYSIREIANMQSDEFQRLFHYPDGSNLTLDKTVGTIVNLLVNESRVAFRTPTTVEGNVGTIMSLNSTFSERETYGTFLKRGPVTGDVPENDAVLTFVEGKNGEKSYYIDGDVMEQAGAFFESIYLKSNLSDEEIAKSIEEVDATYQMYLEWDRTRRPSFTQEEILDLHKYYYGRLSDNEEELQRMYALIRKIFPLIKY